MKKAIFPILFVSAALSLFFFLSRSSKPKLFSVEERVLKKVVYASGYVYPIDYVVVKSEVSGYVKEIKVREGDRVKKGQVLAVLDYGPLGASLKELDYKLELVKKRLDENSDYIKRLKEQVNIAKRNMEQAERGMLRRKRLLEVGLIPKEQFEEAKRNYENAKSEYKLSISLQEDTISALRSEKRSLEASVKRIKDDIKRYYIKSPIEGVLLNKYVQLGDYINHLSQENRLFSVGNPSEHDVVLFVDEEFASMIRGGMKTFLYLDAYPNNVFEGQVALVKNELDRNKKTFEIRVKANLPKNVPAYATVEANVLVEEKKALVIPSSAYKDGYVYKYELVRTVKLPVRVGEEVDGYLEVIDGLKKGDKVIIE
ncbi:MAG: efflux RND transporter periplasmic adaptor subunit [Aquificaceae bacterium]